MKRTLTIVVASLAELFLIGWLASQACGLDQFKQQWELRYLGDLTTAEQRQLAIAARDARCGICHTGPRNREHNAYGLALKELLDRQTDANNPRKIQAALGQVERQASPSGPTFGEVMAAGNLPNTAPPAKTIEPDPPAYSDGGVEITPAQRNSLAAMRAHITEVKRDERGGLTIVRGKDVYAIDFDGAIWKRYYPQAFTAVEPQSRPAVERPASPAPAPAPQAAVQRTAGTPQSYRFEGPWYTSRNIKLDGRMTAVLTPAGKDVWKGHFTGVWQGAPFDYEVDITGPPTQLQGVARIEGADYQWTGWATAKRFHATFTGNKYDGGFELARQE